MHPKAHIKLINCNRTILESILKNNEALADLLDLKLAKNWTTFGNGPFADTLQKIIEKPTDEKWYMYLLIEAEIKTVIGNGGFKGPPDQDGVVEIGYEIAQSFQQKGYATLLVNELLTIAFAHPGVKKVIAHTMEKENASAKLLLKSGFSYVSNPVHPTDGLVYKYEIQKISKSP